jgi:hypothetical protein
MTNTNDKSDKAALNLADLLPQIEAVERALDDGYYSVQKRLPGGAEKFDEATSMIADLVAVVREYNSRVLNRYADALFSYYDETFMDGWEALYIRLIDRELYKDGEMASPIASEIEYCCGKEELVNMVKESLVKLIKRCGSGDKVNESSSLKDVAAILNVCINSKYMGIRDMLVRMSIHCRENRGSGMVCNYIELPKLPAWRLQSE